MAALLLLAAFTGPLPGWMGVANAQEDRDNDERDRDNNKNKDNDNDKREFSKNFGGRDDDRNEDRKEAKDARDAKNENGKVDKKLKALDIKNYGFDGKDAFIEVYGKAGAIVDPHPDEHHDVIAYVLHIVTQKGERQTWAIDSHEAAHGEENPEGAWHAHKVHLTDNPLTEEKDATCLNEVDHITHAMMDDDRAIFENMKSKTKNGIEGIEAKRITSAATVLLELQVDDPDEPRDPEVTPCIAIVTHVYDNADLDKRERRD
jgi:hypothetical protein